MAGGVDKSFATCPKEACGQKALISAFQHSSRQKPQGYLIGMNILVLLISALEHSFEHSFGHLSIPVALGVLSLNWNEYLGRFD